MRGRFALVPLLLAALVVTSCGDSEDFTTTTSAEPTLSTIDTSWLNLLPPPPSYASLSDTDISSLLDTMRSARTFDEAEPRFLIPQFLINSEGLSGEAPPDLLDRVRALYGEAGTREEGAVITGIEPDCADLNGDGECDRLSLRFQCDRCSDTTDLPPMVIEVGESSDFESLIPGYAARFAQDSEDAAVWLLNDADDPMISEAIQQLRRSSMFGLADDVAMLVPTRLVCFKAPRLPRICIPA